MEDRYLSVEEISGYLGVKPDTIYKWIDRRDLPAHKVGRLWKFRKNEIDAWVSSDRAGKHGEQAPQKSQGVPPASGRVRGRA
jgi:excisionase family DNA binding protein